MRATIAGPRRPHISCVAGFEKRASLLVGTIVDVGAQQSFRVESLIEQRGCHHADLNDVSGSVLRAIRDERLY